MKTLALVLLIAWAAVTGLALQLTTPCKTEDSTMCYWDASQHGNGTGKSFVSLTEGLVIITTGGK